MSYERDNIRRMHGYAPGEQPASAKVVKLNTNENPYPPAAAVMEALRAVTAEELRRYPPPFSQPFQQVAAQLHGLAPENIVATNGGDELLRLAITTFVDPGRPIGVAEPSYSLYPVLAEIHDSPTFRVDLNDHWEMPENFAALMNEADVPLTFVVNPHAPTGRLESVERLSRIAAELDGVLLVDEAYVDFVDPELAHDAVELVRRHDNVLLLRTLSKGYSLAGLRFGYGLGAASLIEPMQAKAKDSYNKDIVGQRLAAAALTARAEAADSWRRVRAERGRVSEALAAFGIDCLPSQTNFLLARVPEGLAGGARAIYQALKERGIFIRYFDLDRLRDKLRITIGTPQENDALLGALGEIVGFAAG
ncbi:histidinol-phosphate transaminase [Endothiovibrio diazotrophicus]